MKGTEEPEPEGPAPPAAAAAAAAAVEEDGGAECAARALGRAAFAWPRACPSWWYADGKGISPAWWWLWWRSREGVPAREPTTDVMALLASDVPTDSGRRW